MDLLIEPKTVLQQVIENLRKAIIQGVFQPGERLIEANLCRQLGVSRPSLREALRALEAEKLVVITPNKGPSVAILTWETAQQIYVVRALLEGQAAGLAAQNASEAQVTALERALEDFAAAIQAEDQQALIDSTENFYGILQTAGGNHVVAEVLRSLNGRINYLRATSMGNGQRSRASLVEMREIFEAVKAKSTERARQASIRHIENAALAAEACFDPKRP